MSKATAEAQGRSASVPPRAARDPPPAAAHDLLDGPCLRPDAPPTRMEAALLKDAFEEMLAGSRAQHGGRDPLALAAAAAQGADAAGLLRCIEPEAHILDVTLTELAIQVRVGCQERGQLLEACRARAVRMLAAAAAGVAALAAVRDEHARQGDALHDRAHRLEEALAAAARRAAALEAAAAARAAEADALRAEAGRRAARNGRPPSVSVREQGLASQLVAAGETRDVLLSRIQVPPSPPTAGPRRRARPWARSAPPAPGRQPPVPGRSLCAVRRWPRRALRGRAGAGASARGARCAAAGGLARREGAAAGPSGSDRQDSET
jgi:hypothetical protein